MSLGLLHGAQAEALVMCHEPDAAAYARPAALSRCPTWPIASPLNERCARLTNPDAKVVGLAFNTSALDPQAAERALKEAEDRFGLPAVDPVRTGVAAIVDRLPAPVHA